MTIIHTDRLVIRESSGKDFSRIYAMMLSVSQEETTDVVSSDENEELEKYLAYIHTVYSVFGFGLWTVCLKPEDPDCDGEGFSQSGSQLSGNQEGCIIGRCGLQPVADENSPLGRIELGYLIDQGFRGKGYAYEACRAILDHAFVKLGIEEIFVHISLGNEASAALAGKLGFRMWDGDMWILRNPLL